MNLGLIQTLWADVIACTLRDAGAPLVVISPGSRSTPLVAALERAAYPSLVTLVDERAAAFYALGAARATGKPAALVCTSGSAAAHYLPALVEAAHAGIPLLALTADRPPELHHRGASQTIDQRAIYGGFVRASFDLGPPSSGALAARAVRQTIVQALTQALGPDPGPVHVNVPLRKPLEPVAPTSDAEHAFVEEIARLLAEPVRVAAPSLAPEPRAVEALARTLAAEPRGLIVAGALPAYTHGSVAAIFELARRTGYPIIAEAGSQLRLTARPDDVVFVDAFDVIAARAARPAIVLQLGSEPVAAVWPVFVAGVARHVLAGPRWHDADASASVLLGDVGTTVRALVAELAIAERTSASLRRQIERDAASLAWREDWRVLDQGGREALARALRDHPANEVAAVRDAVAALPGGAILQLGNSLPIRTIDHALATRGMELEASVITQRGAAGIDGLIASAAGATHAGRPVLLVLGDVSFAHDLGGLLAARSAVAPLAILVIDNGGGRIFDGLPVAKAGLGDAFARHWTTPPDVDVVAVARALGLTALPASPETIGYDVTTALAAGVTVIHAPVSATGARDVRATALELAARAPASIAMPTRSSVPVIATGERP